jgi:hypothetical protein
LWFNQTWDALALYFPRVTQLTWFMETKIEEGIETDWDIDTPAQVKSWVDGYNRFLNYTGTVVTHNAAFV